MIKGIIASEGIAIGKAVIHCEQELILPDYKVTEDQLNNEIERFKMAREQTTAQLDRLYRDMLGKFGEEEAAVFEGHMMVAEDEELEEEIFSLIGEGKPAAVATHEAIQSNIQLLETLEDAYLRERVADFRDVGLRMVKNILGIRISGLENLEENSIVIANDLTPSDTAQPGSG